MSEFYDAILGDLDALDGGTGDGDGPSFGGEPPIVAPRASGSLVHYAKKTGFHGEYDSNTDVIKQVQAAINAAGYTPALKVDGSPGPATAAGVKWVQSQKGLPVDGVINDATIKALGIKLAAGAANWLKPVAQPPIAGLAQPVVDNFPSFSTKFEGYTPYMYADSKGLVTTGIGNLIDPIGQALSLPWKNQDGSAATPDQITAAWNAVKSAYPGTQSTASQSLTTIRLDAEGIAELVHQKMAENQAYLAKKYPQMDAWPADAQMAHHSISWAWGPGFSKVWGALGSQFDAAVNATPPDFVTAASVADRASKHEESINPGIVPRDAANQLMFTNAAKAVQGGGKGLEDLIFPLSYDSAISSGRHALSAALAVVKRHPVRTVGVIGGILAILGTILALVVRSKHPHGPTGTG
jgi:peptidoglycan hydrolase-like protein with peptidoglycan-binding domain